MPEKRVLRFTSRVHEDHPMFQLLDGSSSGGRLLLDYATSWHAFSLGRGEREINAAPGRAAEVEEVRASTGSGLDDQLVADALR